MFAHRWSAAQTGFASALICRDEERLVGSAPQIRPI
jgi:hypothetical protein